ncbi:hypothetical protein B5S33_g3594 [[Candida] boidinii]|nr:hypothetical protein B5S30_g3815 [[Candida] boidinii]OWB84937.1 hypothetical protein B5S33_g3594 [[Candida] boidinii]
MRSAASTATKAILKQTEANQQQANSKPEQTPEATPNKRVETEEHLRNAETLGSIGSRKLLESRATWKLRAGETGMRSTGYSDTSAVPQRFILFYRSLFPDSMVQTKTLATAADPPLAELTTTTTAIVLC